MKTLDKIVNKTKAVLTIAAISTIAGCSVFGEPNSRDVTRSDFNEALGSVVTYEAFEGEKTTSPPGRDLYIKDLDGDRTADLLQNMGNIYWYAPELEDEYSDFPNAKVMTPEIREAATKALNADRNLAYEIAKQQYINDTTSVDAQK